MVRFMNYKSHTVPGITGGDVESEGYGVLGGINKKRGWTLKEGQRPGVEDAKEGGRNVCVN